VLAEHAAGEPEHAQPPAKPELKALGSYAKPAASPHSGSVVQTWVSRRQSEQALL